MTAPSTAWPSAFAALAARSGIGCEALSSGSLMTMRGRTRGVAASTPRACRCTHVISAALSVVGTAATTRSGPMAAAIAFATSITRPPPSATIAAGVAGGRQQVGGEVVDAPGGDEQHLPRRRPERGRGREPALCRQQQVALAEQARGVAERAATEADRAVAVAPGEVVAHRSRLAGPGTGGSRRDRRYDHMVLGRRYDEQDCSIARALEVVGERWTLLILRESFLGTSRFDDFHHRLGIARNVLQTRLERLVEEGVLARFPYQERPARFEYRLTQEGRDLLPVLVALLHWGDRHRAPEAGPRGAIAHASCGGAINAALQCERCGATVERTASRSSCSESSLTPLAPRA